jgi:hypothetical protein
MQNGKPDSPTAQDRVAQLAVAQFLLFEATVESLSVLGERLARRGKASDAPSSEELIAPFRARYKLMRRVLREK